MGHIVVLKCCRLRFKVAVQGFISMLDKGTWRDPTASNRLLVWKKAHVDWSWMQSDPEFRGTRLTDRSLNLKQHCYSLLFKKKNVRNLQMVLVLLILMTSFSSLYKCGGFRGIHFQSVLHLIGRVRGTHADTEHPSQEQREEKHSWADIKLLTNNKHWFHFLIILK